MGEQSGGASQEFIGRAGGLVALGAALLPVAGVLARLVAFSTSPLSNNVPFELAWSAPIPALALTGIVSVVTLAIPTLLLVPYLIIQGRRQPSADRRLIRAVVVVGSILLIGWVLVMPAWPLPIVVLASVGIGNLLVRIQLGKAERFILSQSWVTVLIVFTLGAVLWGLSGLVIGADASDFRFKAEASGVVPDGRYVELGDNGSAIFLQDCSHPSNPAIKIDRSLVLVSRYSTHQTGIGPSLWDILVGHHGGAGLGFRSAC